MACPTSVTWIPPLLLHELHMLETAGFISSWREGQPGKGRRVWIKAGKEYTDNQALNTLMSKQGDHNDSR